MEEFLFCLSLAAALNQKVHVSTQLLLLLLLLLFHLNLFVA